MVVTVYHIRNVVTGRYYVGSTVSLRQRQMDHFSYLRRGKHHSRKLQRAFDKYGESTFVFKSLEQCSIEIRDQIEQKWMDQLHAYDIGFNCSASPSKILIPMKTRKTIAKKCRKKLSEDAKSQWEHPEIRERMLKAMRKASAKRKGKPGPRKGVKVRDKSRKRMSRSAKRKYREQPELKICHSLVMKDKFANDKAFKKCHKKGISERWDDPKQRQLAAERQRQNGPRITFNGETKLLSEWSEKIGISKSTILYRLNQLGLSVDRALNPTRLKCGRRKVSDGV